MTVAELMDKLITMPPGATVRISQPQFNDEQAWNDYPELCNVELNPGVNEVRLTE